MRKRDWLPVLIVAALAGAAALQAGEPSTAAAPAEAMRNQPLVELFRRGGGCMWAILGCAVAGLAFFFERWAGLRRKTVAPRDFEKDVVHVADTRGIDAALALCLDRRTMLARVLYAALLRFGSASRQELLAAMQDEGTRVLYDLRRNGRWIGLSSQLALFFGLLGAALGLFGAFEAAAGEGGRAAYAQGVSGALVCASFSLASAIPLWFFHHLVRGRSEDLAREVEARGVEAIISLERKARRSIRQIEDVEENLETKDMLPPREVPGIDAAFEDQDLEKSIKTSVTTPAGTPVIVPPPSPQERAKEKTRGAPPAPPKGLSG